MTAEEQNQIAQAALIWAQRTWPRRLCAVRIVEGQESFRVEITDPRYRLLNMQFDTVQEALTYFNPLRQMELFT